MASHQRAMLLVLVLLTTLFVSSVVAIVNPTKTPTPTDTSTRSRTRTRTRTETASDTDTRTGSETDTRTNTITRTNTATQTSTIKRTASSTPSGSPTSSPTSTPTPTGTASPSPTPTQSETDTRSPTTTETDTGTATVVPTKTPTDTRTSTITATSTNSPTATQTLTHKHTLTPTNSETDTLSSTATRTATLTNTQSPTPTSTQTLTVIPTTTATRTATRSATTTDSETDTRSSTATFTRTPTSTSTGTPTPLKTSSPTLTFQPSVTPSNTITETDTRTVTLTETLTSTPGQVQLIGTAPVFGSVVPAGPVLFQFIFDRNVSAAKANPAAMINLLVNSTTRISVGVSDANVSIVGNTLRWSVILLPSTHYDVDLDSGIVYDAKGDDAAAYFLRQPTDTTHLISLQTTGMPTENSYAVTLVLDMDVALFQPLVFCQAMQAVVRGVPCASMSITPEIYSAIIHFQFMNLAINTTFPLLILLDTAILNGDFGRALQRVGLGPYIPGTFVVREPITATLWTATMNGIDVSVVPDLAGGKPTKMTLTARPVNGLPLGGLIDIILPPDFIFTQPLITVNISNGTTGIIVNKTYQGVQGPMGASNILTIDTSFDPFPSSFSGIYESIVLSIPQGLQTPLNCAKLNQWVWGVKLWNNPNRDDLYDFALVNPATDTCTAVPAPTGLADSTVARSAAWLDFTPKTSFAGETVALAFSGFRTAAPFMVKVAQRHDGSCEGLAPGSAAVQTDERNTASVIVARAGTYDVCVQHRTNWEPTASPLIVNPVNLTAANIAASGSIPFLGFASCASAVQALGASQYCGCFYNETTTPATTPLEVQLDLAVPFRLFVNKASSVIVRQGCCATGSQRPIGGMPSGLIQWGICIA